MVGLEGRHEGDAWGSEMKPYLRCKTNLGRLDGEIDNTGTEIPDQGSVLMPWRHQMTSRLTTVMLRMQRRGRCQVMGLKRDGE